MISSSTLVIFGSAPNAAAYPSLASTLKKRELIGNFWYREQLNIDFEALPSWEVINEMRLVANTVKHGEGG
jgi:hypothetical protein